MNSLSVSRPVRFRRYCGSIKLNRDDVRDSLGEIVNMIAGNFKALLPDGAAISMPSVVEGSDYTLRVRGGRIVTNLTMRWRAIITPSGALSHRMERAATGQEQESCNDD